MITAQEARDKTEEAIALKKELESIEKEILKKIKDYKFSIKIETTNSEVRDILKELKYNITYSTSEEKSSTKGGSRSGQKKDLKTIYTIEFSW